MSHTVNSAGTSLELGKFGILWNALSGGTFQAQALQKLLDHQISSIDKSAESMQKSLDLIHSTGLWIL